MTTKVTIINHGPDPVVVQAYNIPTDGTPAVTSGLGTPVEPGKFTELFVHYAQELRINEVKP